MSAWTFLNGVLVGMFASSQLGRLERWLGRRRGKAVVVTHPAPDASAVSHGALNRALAVGMWPEPVPLDDGSDDA